MGSKQRTCAACAMDIRKDRAGLYCSRECKIRIEGGSKEYQRKLKLKIEASTAWRPLPLVPTVEITTAHPVLVIGDIHCPIHSKEWAYKAIVTAKHFGCKHVIINGDLIDANTISRHLGGEWRRKNELNDDIESAAAFIKILSEEFEQVTYTLGNHTQRMMRSFMGEVSFDNLFKIIYEAKNFKATERHYCIVNKDIRVLHPRAYSKIRGKLAQDYCQRYQCHIVTGHHHNSASTISADGKWQAVEVGCLADVKLFGYAQYSMMGFPEMLEGFAIILPESEGSSILNFNKFTPWARYGLDFKS